MLHYTCYVWRSPVRHVLYGSKVAIARTISILHVKGYAETFEWSMLLPTDTPGEYMTILSRLIVLVAQIGDCVRDLEIIAKLGELEEFVNRVQLAIALQVKNCFRLNAIVPD